MDPESDFQNFEAIVIGGGGNKGIISLGVLTYYEEIGKYVPSEVKEYAGTSIGSVICLLLNCGYTPQEIFIEIDRSSFLDISPSPSSVKEVLTEFGLSSIQPFLQKVSEMVMKKLGFIPTLGELHELSGKTIHISRSNISKKKEEILNYKTYPNLNCIEAVKQSCNLPFMFHRCKSFEGDLIADGALVNNYPWEYISSECKIVLGIYLGEHREIKGIFPENNIFGYAWDILTLIMAKLSKLRLDAAKDNVTTVITEWNGNFVKMNLTHKEKMEMYIHGWHCAEKTDHTVIL